jgi:hypothetical protein
MTGSHLTNPRGRAGGPWAAMQDARNEVWLLHMSDEQRRSAAQEPRPERLRAKSRHTSLLDLTIEQLWPATGVLSDTVWRGNASNGGLVR